MPIDTSAAAAQPEQLTDGEVAARVVAGDRALFEILMRRHNQRIYRAVRAVLGSDEDAEDVVQEAYLRAYRSLHQFEGRAQFSTWLTRIAVNEALARRGKSSVRALVALEDENVMTLVREESPDPEQQTFTTELRDVLEREMSALPATYRTVIMLRDVEGLSTAETAESLGVSEDVVKTRLHRGRAMLRERIEERTRGALGSLFPFGNARCDRVVASVMARLGE